MDDRDSAVAKKDDEVQSDLAVQMLKTLFEEEGSKFIVAFRPAELSTDTALLEDERKLLCQLLPKLYIPEQVEDSKLRVMIYLIESLRTVRSQSPSNHLH